MGEKKSVILCATMDTKWREALYLKNELESLGHLVKIVDMGLRQQSPPGVYVTQAEVAGPYLEQISRSTIRSEAANFMARGLREVVARLYETGELDGIIAVGGSGGSTLASSAMHALPLGIPKIIVTTMASGNTLPYVLGEDILLMNPVVDIQNINFLTEHVLRQAAAVLSGMMNVGPLEHNGRKAIAMTGFGVTTPCIDRCAELLQNQGYEVLIFHARGISGGKIMEKMIEEDHFCAVLDITTTELADEVAGGIYSVGKQRLRTAVRKNLPYIVVPGALEMINLGSEETLLPFQKQRTLYCHSPSSVKMRANCEDMKQLGELFIDRLMNSRGNTCVIIPTRGFSEVDKPGKVFYDPKANEVFINELKYKMPPTVPVELYDYHINDQDFADILVKKLLRLIEWDNTKF